MLSRWRSRSNAVAPPSLHLGSAGPSSPAPSGAAGSLHRVQQPVLPVLDLHKQYDVVNSLGEGCFSRVLLCRHRNTTTQVALKAIHDQLTSLKDFYREFHYAYRLSPHPNILKVYSVAFRAPMERCLVFAMEVAPRGNLMNLVVPGGLPEADVKRVTQQIGSALQFMHSSGLVHRDVKPENILVWNTECVVVKLCDFGCTRPVGELDVRPRGAWYPALPPELSDAVRNERVASQPAADCWSFAISIITCLTGSPPWRAPAPIADTDYRAFRRWQKRRTVQVPPAFKRFTPRLQRMLKRMLDPCEEKRAPVTEVNKYLKDLWILEGSKGAASPTTSSQNMFATSPATRPYPGAGAYQAWKGPDLFACPKCPAPTSQPTEPADPAKSRMRHMLSNYGLETTVDQRATNMRIWDWVQRCQVPPPSETVGI